MKQIHPLPLRCCGCTPDPSGLKSLRMTPLERDGFELSHYPKLSTLSVMAGFASHWRHNASSRSDSRFERPLVLTLQGFHPMVESRSLRRSKM